MKTAVVKTAMKVKRSRGERIFAVFNYILLTILAFVCLYPVWHVLMASFSDGNMLARHRGLLFWPEGFSLEAYARTAQNPSIMTGYLNTLFILVIGTFLDVVMTSMGAYFLSRERVMFKKPIMLMITFTMFFGGGMIPFYLTLKDLHLTGTLWGLIFPFLINTHNLIILRSSFQGIPASLIDAAQIDGASHLKILFMVVLPLSKAILAVMVLYYGVGIWNSWFWATAILRKHEMYPLQVAGSPVDECGFDVYRFRRRFVFCRNDDPVCHGCGQHIPDSVHLPVPAEIFHQRDDGRSRERMILGAEYRCAEG